MKRFLLIFLGLVIGLATAVLVEGKMGHLRWVFGEKMPEWSNPIGSNSSVLNGNALVDVSGLPASKVEWRFQTLNAEGISYRLTIVGDSVNLSGTIMRPYFQQELLVNNIRGDVDLAALPIVFFDREVAGGLNIQQARFTVDSAAGEWKEPAGVANVIALHIDGQQVGNGVIKISPSDNGEEWLGDLSISGNVTTAEFLALGTLDDGATQVTGEIRKGTDFPDDWDRALSQSIVRNEDSWRVDQEFDLGLFLKRP